MSRETRWSETPEILTCEREAVVALVGRLPLEECRNALFAAVMGLREYHGLAVKRIDFVGEPLDSCTASAWGGLTRQIGHSVEYHAGTPTADRFEVRDRTGGVS